MDFYKALPGDGQRIDRAIEAWREGVKVAGIKLERRGCSDW